MRRACGPLGASGQPRILQIFVDAPAGMDEAQFDRALFRARRLAEKARADDERFYVVSLSAATFVAKAMVAPGQLRAAFPDFRSAELAATAAVFHQRFSTNTMPRWRLAQPFRMLAHNGEINTIKANRNWVCARGAKYKSPLVDFSGLGPAGQPRRLGFAKPRQHARSAGRRRPRRARRDAHPHSAGLGAREDIDEDLEAFYEYYALHTEPWDGPAGIVLCDARYAACSLDRNGLRPARWARSDDNHLIVASEAGLWDVPPERIVAKGRLGPGEMIAVDLVEHRLLDNAAIDDDQPRARAVQALAARGRDLSSSRI